MIAPPVAILLATFAAAAFARAIGLRVVGRAALNPHCRMELGAGLVALFFLAPLFLALPIEPFSSLVSELWRACGHGNLRMRFAGFAYGLGAAAACWGGLDGMPAEDRPASRGAASPSPAIHVAASLFRQWLRFGLGGIVLSAILFPASHGHADRTLLASGCGFVAPWIALTLVMLATAPPDCGPGLAAPEESPLFAEIAAIARSISRRRSERAARRFRIDRRLATRCEASAITALAAMRIARASTPAQSESFDPAWIERAVVIGLGLAVALEYGGPAANGIVALLLAGAVVTTIALGFARVFGAALAIGFPSRWEPSRRAYAAWRDAEAGEDRSREAFDEALRQAAWAANPAYRPDDEMDDGTDR